MTIPFLQDLLVNPATRNANDISHRIVAAGSRFVESTQKFIEKLKVDEQTSDSSRSELDRCKVYDTYDEGYADSVCHDETRHGFR